MTRTEEMVLELRAEHDTQELALAAAELADVRVFRINADDATDPSRRPYVGVRLWGPADPQIFQLVRSGRVWRWVELHELEP